MCCVPWELHAPVCRSTCRLVMGPGTSLRGGSSMPMGAAGAVSSGGVGSRVRLAAPRSESPPLSRFLAMVLTYVLLVIGPR